MEFHKKSLRVRFTKGELESFCFIVTIVELEKTVEKGLGHRETKEIFRRNANGEDHC